MAIIGAGGIGFDVAEFLLHDPESPPPSVDLDKFLKEWGIDKANDRRGGLLAHEEHAGAFRCVGVGSMDWGRWIHVGRKVVP